MVIIWAFLDYCGLLIEAEGKVHDNISWNLLNQTESEPKCCENNCRTTNMAL